MKTIERMLEYFTGLIKKMKGRQRAVPASVVIVIVMICALILPAITPYHYIVMEKPEIEAAYSEGNFEESGMIYKDAKEETGEAAAKDGGSEADDAAAEGSEDSSSDDKAAEDNSVREDEVSGEAPSEEAVEETAADDGASDEEAAEADHESADSTDESSAVQTEEKNDGASPSSSDSASKKAKEEVRLITEDTQLVYKGSDCSVYAEFGESAKLPVGVKLEVREITKESDPEAYQKYYDKALTQMKGKYGENAKLSFAGFYDITFRCEDKEVEPGGNVNVRIEYNKAVETEKKEKVDIVHFDKKNDEKAEVIDSDTKVSGTSVKAVAFKSDQFSVFGVLRTDPALSESPSYMHTGAGDGLDNAAGSELEIDKTASPLNKDYQSTVTLTFPGMQENYSYDVVFVLDKSASAAEKTTQVMKEYISAISGNGAAIKTGVVCFYYEGVVTKDLSPDEIDYSKININTTEWGKAHGVGRRPYGTNLADGIAKGKAMLDEDTSVTDPGHKYLIVISDGDTHIFNNASGDPAVVVDIESGSKLAGPTAYERKYGNFIPPQDWGEYLTAIGALIVNDGETYYYSNGIHYNNSYSDAESYIPAGELNQHAVSSDVALYNAYQNYLSAVQAGYKTFAVGVPSPYDRFYGPDFMKYLNGGEELVLEELIDTICYVGSGSTVTDEMGAGTDSEGNEYNYDFINDPARINVKLNGKTLAKKTNDDGSYSFGENEEFVLTYDEAKDSFTFAIYTNITVMDELQIIYDVQLTNPQTVPGAYADLYTNIEAVLHPKDSRGGDRPDEIFPEPKLTYENPDIDKKILEDGELKTENEVSIGDTVTYKVPVTIPEDVFEVPIIVTDTIDQALTLNEDSLEADQGVTGLQFKENTSEKKEGCKVYTVTIPGETVKANAGKTITLTYTAVLNDKAVIDGAGSPNTVRLNYNVDNAIHVNIQSEDHTVVTKTHQGGKDKPEPDPDKPTPDPDKPNQDPDKPMPNPDHPDKPSKVPQTGQLWWPVIALGCAGAALLAVGIFKKKRK